MSTNYQKIPIVISIISLLILSSCKNAGDARKRPPNVKDRVQKNIEEGRGFTLMGSAKKILASLILQVPTNFGEQL